MNAPPPEGAVHPLVEPRCGYRTTIDAQSITNTSPKTQAWACAKGQTNWAVSTLNPSPQPFFDHLAATVEQLSTTRSVLRHIIALADDAPGLTDT